ncbi:MAG: hypothetical protein ACXVB9_06970 [Bdellovibrionota bacterium]
MKTLILSFVSLTLVALNARADGGTCPAMPVCRIVPVGQQLSLAQYELQINGIIFEDDASLQTSGLVDLMARYERKGICKAVYPAGY